MTTKGKVYIGTMVSNVATEVFYRIMNDVFKKVLKDSQVSSLTLFL